MKDKLHKLFDDFTIAARVMPVVTIILPFLFLALRRGMLANSFGEAGFEFIIVVVLALYGAFIARERGKECERKMYKELGGMPTTIIMRFSDNRIDAISKKQYHEWLNKKGFGCQLPLSLEEERKDSLSDEKYINAMSNLRIHVNKFRNKNPRVYQELKKYNYWRNLYGCKNGAIVSYVVVIAIEVIQLISSIYMDLLNQSLCHLVGIIVLLTWTMIFCLVVTKNTVKKNAFDYAVTLLETGCKD